MFKTLSALIAVLMISGCGPSYESVKPNITSKPKQVKFKDVVDLQKDRTIQNHDEKMGGIIIDLKIAPQDKNFLVAKLTVDGTIHFDYISYLETVIDNGSMLIVQEAGVPPNFLLTEKVYLPVYKVGVNVFDLNNYGNFAYISDKRTIKVVKKIPTETLSLLAKNHNYSRGSNVLTIRTRKDISQMSFREDSNNMVILLKNGDIELWNYLKKRKIRRIAKHIKNVNFIATSPKGKYLLVSTNKKTKLIDLSRNKTVMEIKGDMSASSFTKDESSLAVAGVSGEVKVYDLKTRKLKSTFKHKHKGLVHAISFSPIDNNTLITAGQDGVIKSWNLLNTKYAVSKTYNTYNHKSNCNVDQVMKNYFEKTSDSLKSFRKRYNPKTTECNILGDKRQVISYAQRGILYPYMTSMIDTLVNKYEAVKSEWINVDVTASVGGLATDDIYRWKEKHSYTSRDENGKEYKSYSRSEFMDYLKNDKKIQKYKKQAIAKKTDLYTHLLTQMNGGAIYGLVPFGDKIYPYGTGFEEKYSYYQTDTPEVRLGYGMYQYMFEFENTNIQHIYRVVEKKSLDGAGYTHYTIKTKDDHTIITIKDNLVQFIDYKNDKISLEVAENDDIKAVAYSKDSDTLAIGLSNGKIKLWDLKKKVSIGTLTAHTADISALSFAKKGTILISGAYDEKAIVWDVKKRAKIVELNGFERAAKTIKVLPKQNLVAIVSSGIDNSDISFYSLKNYKLAKKISPEMGRIRGADTIDDGKHILFASNKHIASVDTKSYKTRYGSYKASFHNIKGIAANKDRNMIYAVGNTSTFDLLNLRSFDNVGIIKNMKKDKYGWGKIYGFGKTEQSTPVVSDGNNIISIYK